MGKAKRQVLRQLEPENLHPTVLSLRVAPAENAETSRCLLGHNGVIEFLEVTLEGALAATVENGSHHPAIR